MRPPGAQALWPRVRHSVTTPRDARCNKLGKPGSARRLLWGYLSPVDEIMDVEVTVGVAAGKRAHEDIIQAVRTRLYPFEARLQRVQIWTENSGSGHICCVQARSERGRTLAIEREGRSLLEAIGEAVSALVLTLERGRTSETITRPYASRVLLALHDLDASAPSLRWARRLANAFAGGLDACRVLKGTPSPTTLASGRDWLQATRLLLATQRDTRSWCGAALPEAVLADRAVAGSGAWAQELGLIARRKGSDWIVVHAGDVTGGEAAALAVAAACPVLVARAPTARSTLLVNVESNDENAAALASAAELSEALDAPVLAFRNLFGRTPDDRSAPEVERLAGRWQQIQRERHPIEAGRRVPLLDVVLGFAPDHTQALLSQALREDAEMIVTAVGGAALAGEVEAIVERAVRSVLLVPTASSSTDERAARRAPPRSGVVPAAGTRPVRATHASARPGSRS